MTDTAHDLSISITSLIPNVSHTIRIRPRLLSNDSVNMIQSTTMIYLIGNTDNTMYRHTKHAKLYVDNVLRKTVLIKPTEHIVRLFSNIALRAPYSYGILDLDSTPDDITLIHSFTFEDDYSTESDNESIDDLPDIQNHLQLIERNEQPPVPLSEPAPSYEFSISRNNGSGYNCVQTQFEAIEAIERDLPVLFNIGNPIECQLGKMIDNGEVKPLPRFDISNPVSEKKFIFLLKLSLSYFKKWNIALTERNLRTATAALISQSTLTNPTVRECYKVGTSIQTFRNIKDIFNLIFRLHSTSERTSILQDKDHKCSFLVACPFFRNERSQFSIPPQHEDFASALIHTIAEQLYSQYSIYLDC